MKHEDITAWALNELSSQEREHIEAALRESPQALQEASETKTFCAMLQSELRDDSLELTPQQRQDLQNSEIMYKALTPTFTAKPVNWRSSSHFAPWAAVAACAAIGGFLAYQHLTAPAKPQVAAVDTRKLEPEYRMSLATHESAPPAMLSGLPGSLPAMTAVPPSSEAGDKLAEVIRQAEPALPITQKMALPSDSQSGLVVRAGAISGYLVQSSELQPSERLLREQKAPDSETYAHIRENTLQDVIRQPLSTFSIDVDTASYANVRRFLNQNMLPPLNAVRIEELINYFPTQDAAPAADSQLPFAVKVEVAACPWQPRHQLARIAVKGREIEKGSKASNLVFLVDVSGSMNEPQKLPLVQQSLRMLAQQLGENDHVSLVTYASGTQVVLQPTGGQKNQQIIAAIDQLRANGSTNGAGGLQLAYQQAVAGFIPNGINRVILCTDGDFNVGISQPAELHRFITEKARSGVFLSVLGYGSGNLQDRTMEILADKGNGNYAYIDSLSEARKVLVEQMQGTLATIAKDVKIQVEFNPAQVRSYRLIGYENRLLAKEDFNNDKKDAGEIGSGHSVVALYELVPANLPAEVEPDHLVDTLKYQTLTSPAKNEPHDKKPAISTAASTFQNEAMTVKLRYKQPEGDVSAKIEVPVSCDPEKILPASPEMSFSAAVAGFGMLLRDSGYQGRLTWEEVRKLALKGKGSDKLGYRGEFIQLIDKAAGLKQTR